MAKRHPAASRSNRAVFHAAFSLSGPGESVTLTVPITVPGRPGNYRLQFDMVQELVAWFEAKGAPKLIVPVTVQ